MSGFGVTNSVSSTGAMCLIKAIYLVHAVAVVAAHGRGSCCDHPAKKRKSVKKNNNLACIHIVKGSHTSRLEFLFI